MADDKPLFGTIGWTDLTVPNAEEARDFYKVVAGWESAPVKMGDYDDYNMMAPSTNQPTAGICHARGANADLPAQWLIYILVEDLDASIAACKENGGEVLAGPKYMGESGGYAVIRDPAGAVAALFAPAQESP